MKICLGSIIDYFLRCYVETGPGVVAQHLLSIVLTSTLQIVTSSFLILS